jgi:hypothetical protein
MEQQAASQQKTLETLTRENAELADEIRQQTLEREKACRRFLLHT